MSTVHALAPRIKIEEQVHDRPQLRIVSVPVETIELPVGCTDEQLAYAAGYSIGFEGDTDCYGLPDHVRELGSIDVDRAFFTGLRHGSDRRWENYYHNLGGRDAELYPTPRPQSMLLTTADRYAKYLEGFNAATAEARDEAMMDCLEAEALEEALGWELTDADVWPVGCVS